MVEIRMLDSVAGNLDGNDCPNTGDVIKVSEATAAVWADGVRAERVIPTRKRRRVETTAVQAPERAVLPRPVPHEAA